VKTRRTHRTILRRHVAYTVDLACRHQQMFSNANVHTILAAVNVFVQ